MSGRLPDRCLNVFYLLFMCEVLIYMVVVFFNSSSGGVGVKQPKSKEDPQISDQSHFHSDFVLGSHGVRGDGLLPDEGGC